MSYKISQIQMKVEFIIIIVVVSLLLTGCEKGSLGVKNGTITGYILEHKTNKPLSDVLVSAENNEKKVRKTALTKGDGFYIIEDAIAGAWDIKAAKPGYLPANASPTTVNIINGETVMAAPIFMIKDIEYTKGTLKGYPVDAVTGSPLRNFTVKQTSPDTQIKSKTFEMAIDFKESGWTGLEGGMHDYLITCPNYLPWATGPIKISNVPTDLGTIKMEPERISISGTLRNLPGYILGQSSGEQTNTSNWVIWAEAGGRIVASMGQSAADIFKGTVVYTITNVPVTVGQVAIKCKIRGYDIVTINPAVSIPAQRPSGIIAGIDCDFANIEPIRRDLRVIVQGTEPQPDHPSTFEPGNVVRVYIKQGGKDVVPYVDITSTNYVGEAYFSNVPTGYPFDIIAINLSRGYISGTLNGVLIPENGNSVFTVVLKLGGGGS